MRLPPQASQTAFHAIARVLLCALILLPAPFAHYGAGAAQAQSQGVELDEVLFVQTPEHDVASNPGIDLIWIPEPLQRACLGKTLSQCSAMDFCIRTTTKSVAMCRNLVIPLSRLPSYPPNMRPRRVMSLSFYRLQPGGPYQGLADAYKSLPRSSLERISMAGRIKARIQFTRSADDDNFRFEQVLATAPF